MSKILGSLFSNCVDYVPKGIYANPQDSNISLLSLR